MTHRPFQWVKKRRGDKIEQFFLILCEHAPSLVISFLNTPIHELTSWLEDNKTLVTAECGCVVGTLAVCARDLKSVKSTIDPATYGRKVWDFLSDSIHVIAPATTKNHALYGINIELLGCDITDEVYDDRFDDRDDREFDVIAYIKDFAWCILRDMGHTHIPRPRFEHYRQLSL